MPGNRSRLTLCGLAAVLAVSLGGCLSGLHGNDEFERYTQRHDTLTMSAGDAKAVNAVTHMIHPWPRYVFDKRIPVDGERLTRAVERYRKGEPAKGAARPSGSVMATGNGSTSQ